MSSMSIKRPVACLVAVCMLVGFLAACGMTRERPDHEEIRKRAEQSEQRLQQEEDHHR